MAQTHIAFTVPRKSGHGTDQLSLKFRWSLGLHLQLDPRLTLDTVVDHDSVSELMGWLKRAGVTHVNVTHAGRSFNNQTLDQVSARLKSFRSGTVRVKVYEQI